MTLRLRPPRLRTSLLLVCTALVCAGLVCVVFAGCSRTPSAAAATEPAQVQPAATAQDDLALLGRAIFFDQSLSASGKQSCATCHDPAHAYAPANSLSVQPGGAGLTRAIFRATPSLMYVLGRTPNWHQERPSAFIERLEERDNPPFGGFAWDGRFKTLGEQAAFPLLSPDEMANPNANALLQKLRKVAYAEKFKAAFGADAFNDPQKALAEVGRALERFELTDASFHPYSSKYDAVLDGKATLTPQESHGLALFNDPARGNCNSCHFSQSGADGSHPLFTNFQFEVLAVPRNLDLVANKDPKFFDLGLCGPLRSDQSQNKTYCGMFKTPTLRNIATRGAFFHNGRFHSLRDALEFYVQRDTNPEKFYPHNGSHIETFDDIPAQFRENVDVVDNPLTKHKGEQPAWSAQEIEDVLAFLNTLTDGYKQQP